MVFHVVVPKQVRDFELGRHRLQFLYQTPRAFSRVNRADALNRIKSEEGFANVAGVELTLLDCARYFHKAGGSRSGVVRKESENGWPPNPAAKPLVASLAEISEKNPKWKLLINEPVEIDT